jgi:hypothetical protein
MSQLYRRKPICRYQNIGFDKDRIRHPENAPPPAMSWYFPDIYESERNHLCERVQCFFARAGSEFCRHRDPELALHIKMKWLKPANKFSSKFVMYFRHDSGCDGNFLC